LLARLKVVERACGESRIRSMVGCLTAKIAIIRASGVFVMGVEKRSMEVFSKLRDIHGTRSASSAVIATVRLSHAMRHMMASQCAQAVTWHPAELHHLLLVMV
jgi:hypothetical protein